MNKYGKWLLKDGFWIKQDEHTLQAEPMVREFNFGTPDNPGSSPAIHIHGATPKKNRRYDLPSQDQIRRYEEEDRQIEKESIGFEKTFQEAKRDLESGKIRINNDVINSYTKTITPHDSVTDDRGITHILPANHPLVVKKNEKVSLEIKGPIDAPLPIGEKLVTMKNLQDSALEAVKSGNHKGRTVG